MYVFKISWFNIHLLAIQLKREPCLFLLLKLSSLDKLKHIQTCITAFPLLIISDGWVKDKSSFHRDHNYIWSREVIKTLKKILEEFIA
jgi:hypothetical protein